MQNDSLEFVNHVSDYCIYVFWYVNNAKSFFRMLGR